MNNDRSMLAVACRSGHVVGVCSEAETANKDEFPSMCSVSNKDGLLDSPWFGLSFLANGMHCSLLCCVFLLCLRFNYHSICFGLPFFRSLKATKRSSPQALLEKSLFLTNADGLEELDGGDGGDLGDGGQGGDDDWRSGEEVQPGNRGGGDGDGDGGGGFSELEV